ncbi:MAG: VanZ family protein [Actinomycetota bacterium]|nr:VanZ family protein [Actinomycetota bacterium]
MRLIGRFLPPLALMGLIYFLSAQPDLKSGLGLADLILRKVIHAGEFGLLWLLWLRALRWRAPGWAAAIAVGYAITDELHQSYVAGRIGSPLDVTIDAAGVALAWWLWRRRQAPASSAAASERAAWRSRYARIQRTRPSSPNAKTQAASVRSSVPPGEEA